MHVSKIFSGDIRKSGDIYPIGPVIRPVHHGLDDAAANDLAEAPAEVNVSRSSTPSARQGRPRRRR